MKDVMLSGPGVSARWIPRWESNYTSGRGIAFSARFSWWGIGRPDFPPEACAYAIPAEPQSDRNRLTEPRWAMPTSTGVYRKRNGYYPAKIVVDGKQLRLGDWPTEKQAARAYDSAARFYRGEDAGRNDTDAPPRSQEELQRRASEKRASRRGDTSVYRGACSQKEKPGGTAQIAIDGWPYFLGRFAGEEQAARAMGNGDPPIQTLSPDQLRGRGGKDRCRDSQVGPTPPSRRGAWGIPACIAVSRRVSGSEAGEVGGQD